jgi:hypothetical protein
MSGLQTPQELFGGLSRELLGIVLSRGEVLSKEPLLFLTRSSSYPLQTYIEKMTYPCLEFF